MVVAAAHVRGDVEVCRQANERKVVDVHALVGDLLERDGVDSQLLGEIRVAVDAPGAVVELDIAAAGGVELEKHRAIGRSEVGDELLLVVAVDGAQALELTVDAIELELGEGLRRRGKRLLGDDALLLELLHELVVLHERVVLAGDGSGHDSGVGRGLLAVELVALARHAVAHAVEPPHEVEVPVAAAELAVGDDVVAGGLLLGHEVADGDVLDGAQLLGGDEAGLAVGAGPLEDVGAQEAAHVVVAEGGVKSAHGCLPWGCRRNRRACSFDAINPIRNRRPREIPSAHATP